MGVESKVNAHNRVPKVLLVCAKHLPSYKIGISQPFRYLRRKGICTYEVKDQSELNDDTIAAADIIIFVRSYLPSTYRYLKLANQMKKRTVYCTDDHFLALPANSQLGSTFHHESNKRAYIQFLKNSHVVRVPSKYFARHIKRHYRKGKVVYFPGCVDFSLFDKLKRSRRNDDTIVIGYEGGAKPEAFKPVIPAFDRILREYGDKVRLKFYGFMPDELKNRAQVSFQSEFIGYRDFIKNLYVNRWDIGIAPLQNTLMHNCKSNNKFREYAACGIPGIYSESPVYSDWVTHKETGYIVPNTERGWYRGLKDMIDHPSLRAGISKKAYRLAKKRFTVEACALQWNKHIIQTK